MGFFTTTKPVITQNEAKIIEDRLYREHGFNQKKLAVVREILKPHLGDAENYGDPVGVSPKEVAEIDENLDKGDPHNIYTVDLTSPEKEVVEKLLDDYLKLRK